VFFNLVQTSLTPLTLLVGNLPIRVRLALTRLLHSQPDLQLLGVCSDASELALVARQLRPDLVIVADADLSALEQLARQYPVPVLLYTGTVLLRGVLQETARWGVYDSFGPALASEDMPSGVWKEDVLRKIRKTRADALLAVGSQIIVPAKLPTLPQGIIVIGASTGGVTAIESLVSGLQPSLNWTIIIALHLPAHFTEAFVSRLRRATLLPVQPAKADSVLEAGKITVVPGGCDMVVQAGFAGPWPIWRLNFTNKPRLGFDDPSINLLMCSAARVAGAQTLGAVLTGLGRDGTLGAQAIREHGGIVLAQDKKSAEIFSMPKSVIEAGLATRVLALRNIAAYINKAATNVRSIRVASSLQTACR